MTAVVQLRDAVVGRLRQLLPGLSEQDAAAALERNSMVYLIEGTEDRAAWPPR
jgi:hypothetical protein